jgi:gamma-glutamyl:cysteine ligase YbdK (ATP-grasp superfamily)
MTSETPAADLAPFHLFQAYGVELEYMIVDAATLDVRPVTDRLLYEVAGGYLSEIEMGELAWSNELALHVVELKTNGPAASLAPLAGLFQSHVGRVNKLLEPLNARLMPTAMHPWMDPHRELKLWPHEYNAVYEAYNRIFDCRGHGWANLQSVHLNLPFADDHEFGRLHAAIRLLMPILPALAASSPVFDRRLTGLADNRLEVYRNNSHRVVSVAADVIPEPVFTAADYDRHIFQPMYDEIAPLDAEGVLRHEWLNSRGAIARFDRNTIEIRVLDVQECPAADLAICAAIANVLRAMSDERWTGVSEQQSFAVQPLAAIFLNTIREAEQAVIDDPAYLAQFGMQAGRATAGELWRHLIGQVGGSPANDEGLQTILDRGPLARRIAHALANDVSRLETVYRELCDCLAEGRMFG